MSSSFSRLIIGLGILLLAAGSTLGVLWFLARKWMSAPAPTHNEVKDAVSTDEGIGLNETMDVEADIIDEASPAAPAGYATDEELVGDDPSSLSLARRMNRGRGEFDLVRRLESVPETTKDLGGIIQRLVEDGSTGPERIKAAKRLGIGRGEVDLVLRLEQFQHQQSLAEQSNG